MIQGCFARINFRIKMEWQKTEQKQTQHLGLLADLCWTSIIVSSGFLCNMLNEILSIFCLVKIYYLLNNKLQSTEWQLPSMYPHLSQAGLLQVPMTRLPNASHYNTAFPFTCSRLTWTVGAEFPAPTIIYTSCIVCAKINPEQINHPADKTKEKRIFLPILKKQINKSLPGEALEPTQLYKREACLAQMGWSDFFRLC